MNNPELAEMIYIVSYWDDHNPEPISTVFDNEEAANSCKDYFSSLYDHCCMDQTYLYSTFKVYQTD